MAGKVKALQQWCKHQCDGYRDVEITNMTSSWKSGLAFCAMIHRYRPDLIDYDSLSKENVYDNNKLAFDVALRELDIPALLDAEDMVAMRVPDKLCIVTYVSQYYNCFRGKQPAGSPAERRPLKRMQTMLPPSPTLEAKRMTTDNMHKQLQTTSPSTKADTTTSTSTAQRDTQKQGTLGDTCAICKEKVYILERHFNTGKLYHRRCFRDQEKTAQRDVFAALRANQEVNTATGQNHNTSSSMDTSQSSPHGTPLKTSTPYTRAQAREIRHEPQTVVLPTQVQMRDHGASRSSPPRPPAPSFGASGASTPSTENTLGKDVGQPILFTPTEKSPGEQKLLSGLLKTLAGVRTSGAPAKSETEHLSKTSVSSTDVRTSPVTAKQTHTPAKSVLKISDVDSGLPVSQKNIQQKDFEKPKSILKTTNMTPPKSILKSSNHTPKQPEIMDTVSSRAVDSDRMNTKSPMGNKHMSQSPQNDRSDPSKKSNGISTKPAETEEKPAWALEAEKRMKARGGKYIDPKKKKVPTATLC